MRVRRTEKKAKMDKTAETVQQKSVRSYTYRALPVLRRKSKHTRVLGEFTG